MKGTVDQVKVRIRTHAPNYVKEEEFTSIEEAIKFLQTISIILNDRED